MGGGQPFQHHHDDASGPATEGEGGFRQPMPERFHPEQNQFPLLSESCTLVGWSAAAPRFEGTVLRHPDAERLIGKPIVIVPALLMRDEDMRIAAGYRVEAGIWVLAIAHVNCLRRMPIVINHQ
jgi:hypothetical protein